MKKKLATIILGTLCVVGVSVAGTMAWLTDSGEEVVNTFKTTDISVSIVEEKPVDKEIDMIPGYVFEKDPKAVVDAESIDNYLFIKVNEVFTPVTVDGTEYGFNDFVEYTVDESIWTPLDKVNYPGVYYKTVTQSDAEQRFDILTDNAVTVKNTVTREMMTAVTSENTPKLTFNVFASQLNETNDTAFDVNDAWDIVKP